MLASLNSSPVAYRETIQRTAMGERKYVRFFDGRGHFAHLLLEVTPKPSQPCSVTKGQALDLPEPCYHAARAAILRRLESGPVHRYPMIGVEVRMIQATYLQKYSYPEAFGIVAEMALDEALSRASLAMLEPWIGLSLLVEPSSLIRVLTMLTGFVEELPAVVSFNQHFRIKVEVPLRLLPHIQSALNLRRLVTFPIREETQYRIATEAIPKRDNKGIDFDWI